MGTLWTPLKNIKSKIDENYFILSCAFSYWFLVLSLIVISTLWAIEICLKPYIIKALVDSITLSMENLILDDIYKYSILFIIISLVKTATKISENSIWNKLNSDLKYFIGKKLINKLLLHSFSFYQSRFAGGISNKVNDIIKLIPDLIQISIQKFYGYTLAILLASYTLWQTNKIFTFLFLSWATIYLLLTMLINNRSRTLCNQTAESRSKMIGYLVDMINNIPSVVIYNNEFFEKNEFSKRMKNYILYYKKRGTFFNRLFVVQSSSFLIYQGMCLYLLINGFTSGTVTAGDFALVLTLNIALIEILENVSLYINTFADYYATVENGLKDINVPIEIIDYHTSKDLHVHKGEIVFKNVSFQYHNRNKIFNNISIKIESKQRIGLVGYTGSGKSTFASLILRFFDLHAGKILIDNQDLREVTQKSIKRSVCIVSQDTILFHRSIYENILYGNISAQHKDVISAAKAAYIHDFIQSLPEKYSTIVGERGIKLSGGQRQRIAIARAILKNSPILILDEATSHLDAITEALIQKSINNLINNKTTLIIAHRLSTLLNLERIVVFDAGKIVGDGNHNNLLKNCVLYKELLKNYFKEHSIYYSK